MHIHNVLQILQYHFFKYFNYSSNNHSLEKVSMTCKAMNISWLYNTLHVMFTLDYHI